MMMASEYKVVTGSPTEIEQRLNELAAQGFEAVQLAVMPLANVLGTMTKGAVGPVTEPNLVVIMQKRTP
jgi:hypothetical protein